MTEINPQLLETIRENQKIRQRTAFESPLWFSLLYLRDHFKHSFAPFHMEMFHLIEQTKINFIVVMAFRESGKSTLMNMAHALWAILGKPGKKFVVIVSKTQEQAKSHFANIKTELETNELLRADFGPFTENEREWNKLSMDLEYHGSKILSITRDQSIRGLIHGSHRPDLIICDDLEDTFPERARKDIMNQTEDLYKRLCDEIMTVGSDGTRIVILGNLISEDSFIMKLRDDLKRGSFDGIFRAYPFMDDRKNNLWPSKFPDGISAHEYRSKFTDDTWIREYLLKIVDDMDQSHFLFPDYDLSDMGEAKRAYCLANQEFRDAGKNDSLPQEALIEQMREYVISAPCGVTFPEYGSPERKKYDANIRPYLNKLRTIRIQKIRDRIRDMP